MRKNWKKFGMTILTALFLCLLISGTAGAAVQYPKTKYVYMNGKATEWYSDSIEVGGLPVGLSISKASIKSSAPSSMRPTSIYRNTWINYDSDGKGSMEETDTISIGYRRPGSYKLSFKIGKKTYTTTVKVVRYVNPISQMTITGIRNGSSTNLAGRTARDCNYGKKLKVTKMQKNTVLKVKAASGWRIESVSYSNEKENISKYYSSRGDSSVALPLGTLRTNSDAYIFVNMENRQNGGRLSCWYILQ